MEVTHLVGYTILLYIVYRILDFLYRKPQLDDFQSKYVLITGCDTGFGHEFAKRLDKFGCHVFAGCLTEKGEDELRKVCSNRLVTVPLDVADHDSVIKAYQTVCEKLPSGKGLWGIANNAGISGLNGPLEFLQKCDFQDALNINSLGMVDITTSFLPLIKKERGRVVNMTSIAGRISSDILGPYHVSKYAAEAFSDSLRRQMRIFGVSVHIIEPGFYKTNIVNMANIEKMSNFVFDRCSKETQEEFGKQYVDKVIDNFRQGRKLMSSKIEQVVDAYEHAMLAKHPRTRYVCGIDARFIHIPVSMLPTAIGDAIMNALQRNKPIPQVCK